MRNIKSDFPIFTNHPWLIYMDSTASSQKPSMVIEGMTQYLENSYSNIHRWMYDIAAQSEEMYDSSKKKVASILWVDNYKEIIYTYNSTYASNLIVWSLRRSNMLKKWDKVLVSIVEHHANIVPWLILKDEIGIEIDYVWVDEEFNLDFDDFEKKYDSSVKVISFTHVSNITWEIFDLEKVGQLKRDDTLFIVDASQSIPHMKVDVKQLNADFLFFTWHKVLADAGIGVLWWKWSLLESMQPAFSGWWAIASVQESCFTHAKLPYKFEPGTPNLTGAASLLKAIEYIENIGWFERVEEIERELVEYMIKKFSEYEKITLIWSTRSENRVSVFSFIIDGVHSNDIADIMAEHNICIRSGQHCAHPFLNKINLNHTSRASLYIYNTKQDINTFFAVLDKIIKMHE